MNNTLSSRIAETIENKIKSGEYVLNEKLPSERSMAEIYGVSRNVVREALGILSEKGFIEIHSGRGRYVSIPDGDDVSKRLEMTLSESNASLLEILEVRQLIEAAIIKDAVKMATRQDIADLRKCYDEMQVQSGNVAAFSQYDAKFHERLSECSGNTILTVLAKTFYRVSSEKLFRIAVDDVKKIPKAQREHKAIIDGIEIGDEAKSIEALDKHIQCIKSRIRKLYNLK